MALVQASTDAIERIQRNMNAEGRQTSDKQYSFQVLSVKYPSYYEFLLLHFL